MSAIANEFARPVRIDTIGEADRDMAIAADTDERTALARRFDLPAIDRLEADLRVRRTGEAVRVEGAIDAAVTQACVVTGAPLSRRLTAPVSLRFVPEAQLAAHEEIELDADDCDTLGYDGAAIDLGEAVAETLYLSLDPFPRAPDADAALKTAGVLGEGETGPFSALGALRDRLGG